MPQYKVSVLVNAYIDAESPEMAVRQAQDAVDGLLANNSRAVAEFEMRYPQNDYPNLAISDISSAEDASIEAQQETEAVSQEELDKPEEVV
jgi:hypothetical protein